VHVPGVQGQKGAGDVIELYTESSTKLACYVHKTSFYCNVVLTDKNTTNEIIYQLN